MDVAGNLYGTTMNGGANNSGTVFELAKTSSGYSSAPTVLTAFNGTDGAAPGDTLLLDGAGNLFGTTYVGGASNEGVVFELSNSGGSIATVDNVTSVVNSDQTFTWTGSPTHTTLTGNDYGNNIFQLGGGSETANGGVGRNVFDVTSSTGQAAINLSSSAQSNELDFLGSIADENLWFIKAGNNLRIDLIGTNTQVDVHNEFSGNSGQMQAITAGGLKLDSQLLQLVQSMATYSANNPGFDPTSSSITTVPNNTNLQNAIAAAWHI